MTKKINPLVNGSITASTVNMNNHFHQTAIEKEKEETSEDNIIYLLKKIGYQLTDLENNINNAKEIKDAIHITDEEQPFFYATNFDFKEQLSVINIIKMQHAFLYNCNYNLNIILTHLNKVICQ